MRRSAAVIVLTVFAVITAYLVLAPGHVVKARKAVVQHVSLPVPIPLILFAHKAAIEARHHAMAVEIRRQRIRAHILFLRRLAWERAKAAAPAPSASPAAVPAPSPTSGGLTPQAIVASLLSPVQAACIGAIFTRESGWNVYATNPTSGAYGIPQALPGSKMASAGADWRTSALTQIKWAIGYVDSRYGSACAAWAYWQIHGNY